MNPVAILRALEFASLKHSGQTRKDAHASPYINHPIAVATVLAAEGGVVDETLLIAAVLHDTIEDTETTEVELRDAFGADVAALVVEATDNKTLDRAERKRLQIVHASHASPKAKQLKIADKICNIRDIISNPPKDWSSDRKRDYLKWASDVVDGCRGVNARLDTTFDAIVASAQRTLGVS
jgi:guanosine-3',5'-bis(diphosphate) 3'-pyrophosphohydrolase